ncbi:MAG: patatin family protein [Desulfobacterales bacterium]
MTFGWSISDLFTNRLYRRGKKALVLEGGGMRGVFLTGVLQAFTDRGYFPWKCIIGSSAGALTGAAYAAGQIHLARDAFFTHLISGDFISLPNIFRPEKHILDLDWMIDMVISGDEPLDLNRLKKSCPLTITATRITEHRPPETIYLNSKTDDVITALKASAAIPYLYRGFVRYRGFNLLDGAILDPIPFKKALAMGFDERDIVVIVSRHREYRKRQESFWIKTLYENYYREEKYKCLVNTLKNRFNHYNAVLDDLYGKHTGIAVINPPEELNVNRLTRDRDKLIVGFELGVEAAKRWLKKDVAKT